DYNVFITQIMGAGCDVVTSGLWGSHFVDFAQQASPFGLFDQIKAYISGGEVASHEIAGKMGDDYPPNVISNTYELWYHANSDNHKAFQEKIAERSGTKETAMWPVLTYTGVNFYAEAVRKSGGTASEGIIKALEGMTIETPVGPRTINADDHQANTGQFWGPMVKREGFSYKVMHPVTYIPAVIE
ncbi:MAG: ABC transporter substrate-binding protein, partial [Alphaproteobacteria bacterium]